jgi:hypothetical protein
MAITLTPFEALSNFASTEEIQFFLDTLDTFRSLFSRDAIEIFKSNRDFKPLFEELCYHPHIKEKIPLLV